MTSINADGNPDLTGAVQLVSGEGILLTQVGQAITINSNAPGVAGSSIKTIAFADSPYTVLPTDWFIKMDCTAGIVVANLPTAVGIGGKEYKFKKIDATANQGTIEPAGVETSDGVLQAVLLGQWDILTVTSDNANWMEG